MVVSGSYGSNLLTCSFTISVLTTDDFGRALDNTNLVWGVRGDSPWFVETNVTDGVVAAAQSGAISSGQTSTLYSVLLGPGTLSFWWAVYADFFDSGVLSLVVNGAIQASISGSVDWQQQQVDLSQGTHLVEWTYVKNTGSSAGDDGSWLDQVTYTGQPAPLTVFCPSSVVVVAAPGQPSATVSYPEAVGTPGATVTASPVSGSAFPVGDTSVLVTASEGTNTASCAFTVAVLATNDFAGALGTTNCTVGDNWRRWLVRRR